MCVERIQRLLTAFVVALASILLLKGYQFGFYLLWFVSAMLVVWGFTNFCPSISVLKALRLKPCNFRN